MEKYRSTADPSTGVHPFVPASDTTGIGIRLIALFVLLPVRCVAIVFGATVACVGAFLGALCRIVSCSVARGCVRVCDSLGMRAVLFGFGVWLYSSPTLERPRSRACRVDSPPAHGDIIFCNHSSYLDPLYLACKFSAIFLFATTDGHLVQTSLWQAFCHPFSDSAMKFSHGRGSVAKSLVECAESSGQRMMGPVVVFAEGVTTNGAGVLQFPVSLLHCGKARVFALGLKYSSSRAETFTVGSGLLHMLRRLTSSRSQIAGRIAGVAPDSDVQKAVADLAGVPALRVGSEARIRFEKHLAETARGY